MREDSRPLLDAVRHIRERRPRTVVLEEDNLQMYKTPKTYLHTLALPFFKKLPWALGK